MITQLVQHHPVRLRAFHDLGWLDDWGQVFAVYDQLTDGTLGFGAMLGEHKYYLRYAGAPTLEYAEAPETAVTRLKSAAPHYQAVPHPALQRLVTSLDTAPGYLCVFEWVDGLPWAPLDENYALFRQASLMERLRMFDALVDLHVQLEANGLVAAGIGDHQLVYSPAECTLTLTSIDDYVPMPARNLRGRVPGSPFYLAPECYQRAAALDETTTVYAVGSLAHAFFGDRAQKRKEAWQTSSKLYDVAAIALMPDRNLRYQSTEAMQQAWRQAVLQSTF